VFTPERIAITTITNSIPAIVTTETDHGLTTGQVVRLHVPKNYGMVQLNQRQVIVTVTADRVFNIQETQVPVKVDVDSRQFDPFVTPSGAQSLTAEVLPMGAGPTPITATPPDESRNTCVTLLDDATVNISTVEIPF